MQTTKEINPHPRIAPCVNPWSVFFFFWCQLLNVDACICHFAREGQVEWTTPTEVRGGWIQISYVTCYTNSIVSCFHVINTKLHNIMCVLVATCVILWSLECIWKKKQKHLNSMPWPALAPWATDHNHMRVCWCLCKDAKSRFTLWLKVKRPLTSTNYIARNQEYGLSSWPFH